MKYSKSDKNNTISVNLVGGLGNQLFGLAFGLAISNKFKTQLVLNTDLISFGSNATRNLAINNFIFTENLFLYKKNFLSKFFLILQRFNFSKKIVIKAILKKSYKIKDLNCINMKNSKISKTYSGYFQDWMFADYLISSGVSFYPTLNRFSTEFLNLLNLSLDNQPIIIHIRLGDYLYLKNTFSLLPEDYYLSAISKISKKSFPIWLVVEDTQEASKFYPKIIKMADKIIDKSYGVEDHEVFYLMSKSSKLVVSNSTFSLWAGWFAINANAKVIAPSEFIVDGIKSMLIDGRWDRIDVVSFDLIEKESLNEIQKQSMARFERFLLI